MKATRRQDLRRIDTRLQSVRTLLAPAATVPADGWIRTLREALGMTAEQLAGRLSLSKQGVHELERREREQKVTLSTLRAAADALDADLVYVIVPRQPIQRTLEDRARQLAAEQVARVARTMQLEDQAVTKDEEEALIQDYARRLLERPRELWR